LHWKHAAEFHAVHDFFQLGDIRANTFDRGIVILFSRHLK